jgi:membrane associated rhomboid family serine protease
VLFEHRHAVAVLEEHPAFIRHRIAGPWGVIGLSCTGSFAYTTLTMGFYDRDYYRQPTRTAGRFNAMRFWSITTWLLVINIAIFVLDGILARAFGYLPLATWGHFSAGTALLNGQAWRFLSFQFLHANLMHLFFNMLALYFFGPMVENYWGWRRFIAFYLLCGIAGPIAYMGFWMTGVLPMTPWVPMVGASAGIFGILIAAARIAPDTTVMLLFPPIPMKLKVLAWIFIGIAAWTVFSQGRNAGGEAAHLGGAAAGFLLMQYPWLLNFAARRRSGMRINR